MGLRQKYIPKVLSKLSDIWQFTICEIRRENYRDTSNVNNSWICMRYAQINAQCKIFSHWAWYFQMAAVGLGIYYMRSMLQLLRGLGSLDRLDRGCDSDQHLRSVRLLRGLGSLDRLDRGCDSGQHLRSGSTHIAALKSTIEMFQIWQFVAR